MQLMKAFALCWLAACTPQAVPSELPSGSPVRADAPAAPRPPAGALGKGTIRVAAPEPIKMDHGAHGAMNMPQPTPPKPKDPGHAGMEGM